MTTPIVLYGREAACSTRPEAACQQCTGHLGLERRPARTQRPDPSPYSRLSSPSKPARTQSLVAASIGKLIFSSLPACLKRVSLPQRRANTLTSQVQNNKKHFPKLAEMGLYTFQIFVAFWFGDDLRNKASDVFWGRFCLTGNIRASVFPTLEWPLKYHFHRKMEWCTHS